MNRRDDLIAALAILAVAGVGIWAMLPPSILSFTYWQAGGEEGTSRSEVARNFLLALIALGALCVGSVRAWSANRQADAAVEQARIAEEGLFTERFSRAAEHLGSAQLPVRLGGIYALWRLIKDSPERDVISVIDILCAFVRHPPHQIGHGPDPGASEDGQASAEKADEAGSTTKIGPDVQTVLNLLGSENAVYRALLPDKYRLNLKRANLTKASVESANLAGASLGGANLAGAILAGADLTGAILGGANLAGAILAGADLTGGHLGSANLAGAHLNSANLTSSYLRRANLTDAELTNANLTDAELTNANLADAELTNTNLAGADLTDTNITQEQLDSACISEGGEPPILPERLERPQKECDASEKGFFIATIKIK